MDMIQTQEIDQRIFQFFLFEKFRHESFDDPFPADSGEDGPVELDLTEIRIGS